MNNIGTIPNGTAHSAGPSVGVSSLVTDANSCLSGGPQMQRSASINTESYMRGLPASPMSFSSNNISGSSQVIDGSSIIQPSPHEDHLQKRRAASSSVTSQPLPPQKKSRADLRSQSDVLLQQQAMQQLHQNPQLHAIFQQQFQQQRLAQHQILQQTVPQQMQRAQQIMQQQQQQQQQQPMRPQLMPQQQMQIGQTGGLVKNSSDSGLCFRRLMQYLYHKRQRPADNSISYWRKLVDEYFAPKARKRWCVSLYDNRGGNASNSFQQTSLDAWRCEICNAKSGKGFEATAEILPRLCQIKFDRGVIDEHLFLDMPHEFRLPNGVMMLEYAKAVQESVYEHVRVIHEGRLRIIFTPELKIISWEFCAKRHEEFVPRRFLAPQVNQLLQVAQKYQTAVNEGGANGVSHQDTQAICNMFVNTGRQMMKNLELQLLNEHGFSKRYVRCLQISEVVNSMKDLIEFSSKHKMGPIDSLKSFTTQNAPNLPAQNMQQDGNNQFMTVPGLPPTDHPSTSMNKMPGMHTEMTNTPQPQQTSASAIALSNYQNMLKSSMGANRNALPHEMSSPFNMQQNGMTGMTGMTGMPGSSLTGLMQQPAQVNQQHLQQHVIQQLLQEVKNNSRQASVPSPMPSPHLVGQQSLPCATNMSAGTGPTVMTGPNAHMMNRSSSFKSVGSNPTAGPSTSSLTTPKPEVVTQPMDLPELDQITDFTDNGLFDSAEFGWKM